MDLANSPLEPDDWHEFRRCAHALLDTCLNRLEMAEHYPWKPPPLELSERYRIGSGLNSITDCVDLLSNDVLPYHTGNTHPNFFGWVHGSGVPAALLGEIVAATMNSNCGGRNHGAILMERAIVDWAREIFSFPSSGSGVLVTGTSQATLLALAAARSRSLIDVRKKGNGCKKAKIYVGTGVHNSVLKAVELLGLGADSIVRVSQTHLGMNVEDLQRRIEDDRKSGAIPIAVVATAGTVDCGFFDPLESVADVCSRMGVWMHVDGAFGAWLALADSPWCDLVGGIELADSIACDFHKWMYIPYDCGLFLMRDDVEHRATFSSRPSYLESSVAGLAAGDPWPCDYGIELSRGNRACKVWTALQMHGASAFGATITENCKQAAYMSELIRGDDKMQLVAQNVSNICVFTADASLSEDDQSKLNKKISEEMQFSGLAVLSTTHIAGRTVLRAAITNHRTKMSNVKAAIEGVRSIRDRIIQTY